MKKKQKRNKTKILLIVAGTLIGLIAVIGISGNLYVDSLLNKTNRSKKLTDEQAMVNQEVKDQVQDHQIVNIALFGSDNQDWNEWTDTEMQRSDATKIISLDFIAYNPDHITIRIHCIKLFQKIDKVGTLMAFTYKGNCDPCQ